MKKIKKIIAMQKMELELYEVEKLLLIYKLDKAFWTRLRNSSLTPNQIIKLTLVHRKKIRKLEYQYRQFIAKIKKYHLTA